MVDVRRFLRQLRPAGAPGAAAGAGVPLDRRAALEVELTPVFQALAAVEVECADIRASAAAEAARQIADAATDASRVAAITRGDAAAARADAMEARLTSVRRESDLALVAAEREAARVTEQAATRTPAMVAEVLDKVRRAEVGEA